MTTTIIDHHQPIEALSEFSAAILGPHADRFEAEIVEPTQMPPEYLQLLAHHEHMTVRLEQFHGRPVALRVLHDELRGDQYKRRIILTLQGTPHVVELGLVRLHLQYTTPAVREEILAKKAPLGDILIRANVLRRIEPRWFFRFRPTAVLTDAFARPLPSDLYGRMGIIYFDEKPAIELVEIVSSQKWQEQT